MTYVFVIQYPIHRQGTAEYVNANCAVLSEV
jgi:hypothetical protein